MIRKLTKRGTMRKFNIPSKEAQKFLWKLGRRIGELRQGQGITQEALARKLGVTTRLVARWEGIENAKILTIHRVAFAIYSDVLEFFKEPNTKASKYHFINTLDLRKRKIKTKRLKTEKKPQKFLWKIGQRIGELRRKRGLVQDELAMKLGVSSRLIARWEGGENTKVLTLYRLAKVLRCTVFDFLREPSKSGK